MKRARTEPAGGGSVDVDKNAFFAIRDIFCVAVWIHRNVTFICDVNPYDLSFHTLHGENAK